MRWPDKDLQVLSHAQLILSPSSAKLTTRKINWGNQRSVETWEKDKDAIEAKHM